MCYNGNEGLTPFVIVTAIEEPDLRVAPVMITFKGGSQREVFQFSSNGKFSGMKTETRQIQVPSVKREDTSASTDE